jgi:FixJ family two-component response regulator
MPPVVYVVDADDAVREGFSRLLRSAGLDPRPYDSAEEFLAQVRDMPGACLLLDVAAPHKTGVQVQERLIERGIRMPMITVSTRDDQGARALARGMGAKLFLRKPVDGQALLDAIRWVTAAGPAR